MEVMQRKDLLRVVKENELKEIIVSFVKKSTGETRIMKCMYGVRVEGGKGMSYNAEEKGLISVFDLEKREYRAIPINNVFQLKTEKGQYKVIDGSKLRRR